MLNHESNLLDEIERLEKENIRLKTNIKNVLQYTHSEMSNGNLQPQISKTIYEYLSHRDE